MCLFMSLCKILLQGSISMKLFGPMRHQLNLRKIEVGIKLLGNICLVADIIPPGIHFAPLVGWHPSFRLSSIVYILLVDDVHYQGIRFCVRGSDASPEEENIFEGVNTMQGVLHVP